MYILCNNDDYLNKINIDYLSIGIISSQSIIVLCVCKEMCYFMRNVQLAQRLGSTLFGLLKVTILRPVINQYGFQGFVCIEHVVTAKFLIEYKLKEYLFYPLKSNDFCLQ